MKHTDIAFLTSNPKKAQDFTSHGFSVQAFEEEIPEVFSENVETVVLYKAHAVKLNNIVVEDTALNVENAEFFGTQIKHVYEEVKEDAQFNGKKALWQVSLCMKRDDVFYIATGELEGILKYPAAPEGYHFDKIFAIPMENKFVHFEELSQSDKFLLGPRFQAIRKLVHALDTLDYSQLKIVENVPEWIGEYQIEREEKTVKKFKM